MPNSRIYFGNSGGAPPVINDNTVIERRTLTAPEIAAKQLTLSVLPTSNAELAGWVDGASTFLPITDFVLTGAIVDWTGKPYDGLLTTGTIIQFVYKKV